MSIKLLPCDYADSEMIVAWLNRESKKGNQLSSINPLFAKFKHEEKQYYYTQVNSVIFNIKLICMITMFLNLVNRRPNVSIVFLVVLNIRRAYLLIYLRLLINMS